MVKANKQAQWHNAMTHKFGVRAPRNIKEAVQLDKENGNAHWQDAMALELQQLMDHNTFRSLGKNACIPRGCQQMPCWMVFNVTQSLKRKARFVAQGDKTEPLKESVYSGVASLRSL